MASTIIRTLVRGTYDLQMLRIMVGNRLVANFKTKLGQAPSKPERELSKEDQKFLNQLRKRYKKITDGITRGLLPKKEDFKGDEVISEYAELCLIHDYLKMEEQEGVNFDHLEEALEEFPIYMKFLKNIRGIGGRMSGVLISEIDIHKARYPSSLWKYAGLDVAPDGRGRSRRKEHLVKVQYKNKSGKMAEKNSITFNSFLKTKIVGVLGNNLIRQNDGKYREAYNNYKLRMENHVDWGTQNDKVKLLDDEGKPKKDTQGNFIFKTGKGLRHARARRYMVKIFLIDLYTEWRTLEGLPVAVPYHEGKLGHKHGE